MPFLISSSTSSSNVRVDASSARISAMHWLVASFNEASARSRAVSAAAASMSNILSIFFGEFRPTASMAFMSASSSLDVISSYAVNIVFVTFDARRANSFCLNSNKSTLESMDVRTA